MGSTAHGWLCLLPIHNCTCCPHMAHCPHMLPTRGRACMIRLCTGVTPTRSRSLPVACKCPIEYILWGSPCGRAFDSMEPSPLLQLRIGALICRDSQSHHPDFPGKQALPREPAVHI
jgi:hypothetical protein